MNIAFYVSGEAGRLLQLISINSTVLKDIRLVISDSESENLKEILNEVGIDLLRYPYNYMNNGAIENLSLSNFILKAFQENNIDYCYCFGNHILKGNLLEYYKNRIINFHPSLLPLFPGLKSIDQAMKDSSVNFIGNTAHFINEKIDAGNVIAQNILPKSNFINSGYSSILNTQIGLLELVHKNLNACDIYEQNDLIYLKRFSSEEKASFIFNHE